MPYFLCNKQNYIAIFFNIFRYEILIFNARRGKILRCICIQRKISTKPEFR